MKKINFLNFPSALSRVLACICLCFLVTVTTQANLSSDQVLLKIQKEAKEAKAVKKVKEEKALKPGSLIGQLAQSGYALMFFFDSSCSHCHHFAPTVKSVSDHYGFQVLLRDKYNAPRLRQKY
ncbi:conjugal transfer protein TraF [Caedibacter taeniospiralis]|jgi:hypothetical protein|uniref:conjugal transfer protein TraF n=1 Tax=Caedibacter taeniospiralis TaxID=28907 RepID=UPI0037C0C241